MTLLKEIIINNFIKITKKWRAFLRMSFFFCNFAAGFNTKYFIGIK